MISARDYLINNAIRNKGEWTKIYQEILDKKKEDNFDATIGVGSENCLTMIDDDYPESLKHCFRPPIVLFYKGDISLLKNDNIVSVIGSHDYSDEGLYAADKIVSELDTIVIGGADGLERHSITLADKSIVVLPHGLDYDKSIVDSVLEKGGLVLTEYPLGTPTTADNCRDRIRIIEKLASKTLVLEVKRNSSANIRVMYSLQYGNDVYVVPHSLQDKECKNNDFIREGAFVCTEASDLGGK